MARPLRGGSGRSSKGAGQENEAPVAKRREKRTKPRWPSGEGKGVGVSFTRPSQVAGLRVIEREVWCGSGVCGWLERELERSLVGCLGDARRESRSYRVSERRGPRPRATRAIGACTCRHELRAPTPEGVWRRGRAEGRRAQGSRNSRFLFIGFV